MPRRLRFNAFTMNCVSHIHHGQWRRPDTRQLDYLDLNTWVELAQLLEKGKFDAIFLADVIGTYSVYGGNRDAAVEEDLQTPSTIRGCSSRRSRVPSPRRCRCWRR